MKMYNHIWLSFIAGAILLAPTITYSQHVASTIELNQTIGHIIDSTENKIYGLFPDYYKNFKGAQIILTNTSEYQIHFYLKNQSEKVVQVISKSELDLLKKQANNRLINFYDLDTAYVYMFHLLDNTFIYGQIKEVKQQSIIISNDVIGELSIHKSKILKAEKKMAASKIDSQKWFDNPHDSRHFFAPTARSLNKGEGYFQDVYLFFGFLNYGISDNILIGGGISFIPIEIENQFLFLNPKVSFKLTDKIHQGGGIFYLSTPDFNDNGKRNRAAILYEVTTYGTQENNITLGLGYGTFLQQDIHTPVIMLGGMYRLSRRTALVSENWFMILDYEDELQENFIYWDYWQDMIMYEDLTEKKTNQPVGLLMYGMRFFSEKLCVDFGFFNVLIDSRNLDIYVPGIPYLDFVVKF